MNTNHLYLEYARVIKMCEGTKLEGNPWVCVKIGDSTPNDNRTHPLFNHKPETYKFAVAVLEGKPVFVGDVIYDKLDEGARKIVVCGSNEYGLIINNSVMEWRSWRESASWTPPTPKRTFTLNGVDLPCPVRDEGDDHVYEAGISLCGYGMSFFFASQNDADQLFSYLKNLLTEARDKP